MFPLPISSYLMIGLAVIAITGVGYGRYEHNAFEEYKAEEIKKMLIDTAKKIAEMEGGKYEEPILVFGYNELLKLI